MSEAEWQTRVPHDGRTVGVVAHHVASVYPIEIHLASEIAAGKSIEGVTWAVIAEMNAKHSVDNGTPTKQETIDLLRQNSKVAADAVRKFSDEQLDRATNVSLYGDAPLTAQFFIEDHALRHSWHHMAIVKAGL